MKSKKTILVLTLAAMCILGGCSSDKTANNENGNTGTNGGTNAQGSSVNNGNTANNGTTTGNGTNIIENIFTGSKIEDGTYRGSYVDGDINQISIEFVIKDNKFESIKYRALAYKGENYLDDNATGVLKAVKEQYQQASDYLVGKNISAIKDLYKPASMVKDVDTVTGATLRSNKLISAIWDGINRHPYKLPE